MSANRKLQGEIQQVLKKVDEGVLLFDEIWEKVYSAEQQSLKEKYEADLKKEIKKLQRLRDQIKSWLSSTEIKDKTQLTEVRKTIESKMEQFKICEKDTKTKAYSKEGLARDSKLDPKEALREEKRTWLNESLDKLHDLVDAVEAEREKVAGSSKNKSKNKEALERFDNRVQKHKWHMAKLELIIKLLDNDDLEPALVSGIQDSLDYYIESAPDDDGALGVEHEFDIYEELELDGRIVGTAVPSFDLPRTGPKDEDSASSPPSARSGPEPVVETESNNAATAKKVAVPPVVPAKSVASKAENPPASKATPAIALKAATKPAASAAVPSVPAAKAIPSKVPSKASSVDDDAKAESGDSASAAAAAPSMSWAAHAAGALPAPAAPATPAAAVVPAPAATSSLPSNKQPVSTPSASIKSAPDAPAPQPTAAEVTATSIPPPAAAPLPAPPALSSPQLQASSTPPPLLQQASKSNPELLSIMAQMKQSMLFTPEAIELDKQSSLLQYNPRNVYAHTHPTFPSAPQFTTQSEISDLFERLPMDTLFFVFYFQQGTYQQYLAAKQLKKHSWRFHKKYMTWFQRHEEPKVATEEYEEGTYVYFDYESGWCQRIKQEFKFEYAYLEDELGGEV